MTERTTAVAVFDPVEAAKALSTSVKKKRRDLGALLGVDVNADDPKEQARAKAMLDRFVAVALHAATSDPKILRASEASIIQAIRDSALLGLEPVGATGDGAIVVYDERVRVERPAPSGRPGATIVVEERVPTAHFQPMYRGLLKLARRSDQMAHVDAHVVYQGDEIRLDLGSTPSVVHFPVLDGSKRGSPVGAYAVAELTNGRRYVEWMTYADVEDVRKSSRGGQANDSPWVRFWAEMARKTVLRRLMKRLPLETMAEHALRIENEAESRSLPTPAPVAGLVAATSSTARKRLRARFGADANGDGDEPSVGNERVPDPDGTPTPDGGPPTLSVVPSSSAVAGEVLEPARDGRCGATTDERLGDVERCDLEPGHAGPDGKPTPHEAHRDGELVAKWPNR